MVTPRPRLASRILLLVALAALLLPAAPRADDAESLPITRAAVLAETGRTTLVQRPFAFVVDPGTPGKGGWSVGYDLGVGSGIAPERPLPVSLSAAGPSHVFGASYGFGERLAGYASAVLLDQGSAAVTAGVAWQLTPPSSAFRATLAAGGLHESGTGASGLTFLASASLDVGRMRLASNLRGERVFAAGRDSLDVVAVAGGSVRVAGGVFLGGEYVGQDLEESFSHGAEGTARHAVGPDLALDLAGGRYQVAVAALFGVTPASPRALVRGGLTLNF